MHTIEKMKPIAPNSLDGYRDKAINRALDAYLTGDRSPKTLHKIGRSLHDVRVRDTLIWYMVTHGDEAWDEITSFLLDVSEQMHFDDQAPVLTMACLAAWASNDEPTQMVLALAAKIINPDYSLLRLYISAKAQGLPFEGWGESMAALSYDEVRYGKK